MFQVPGYRASDNKPRRARRRAGSACSDRRRGHGSGKRRAHLQERPPHQQAAGDLREVAPGTPGIHNIYNTHTKPALATCL